MMHYVMTKDRVVIDVELVTCDVKFAGRTAPSLVASAGETAAKKFTEYFNRIPNINTRSAYANAIGQFCLWTESLELSLRRLTPDIVSAYFEQMAERFAPATINQHIAAVRMLFDWLV